MNLPSLVDTPIEIPNSEGLELTDYQNEDGPTLVEAGEIATAALRRVGARINPETPICDDRRVWEKDRFGPGPDQKLGQFVFAVWQRRGRFRQLLGALLLHDLEVILDRPRILAARGQILPGFETGRRQALADATAIGRIMRHLLDAELEFASGRRFSLLEWVFPSHPTYRVLRPGLPENLETPETVRIAQGEGDDEVHRKSNFADGSLERLRHRRLEALVDEYRRRV